jgi:hypothetical protein
MTAITAASDSFSAFPSAKSGAGIRFLPRAGYSPRLEQWPFGQKKGAVPFS